MNDYRMDPSYREVVRDKVRKNQRKKIAAEGEPERFNVPSAHVRNQMIPFKDRRAVLPNMDSLQTHRVEGGRYSGGAAGHSTGSKVPKRREGGPSLVLDELKAVVTSLVI